MIYNSLLVEGGFFDEVTVGFLVVGHTHASIDQYFSVLRKMIRKANFIASPGALHHLFSIPNPHSNFRNPILQIQITYVHDYVSLFEPYVNKSVKRLVEL